MQTPFGSFLAKKRGEDTPQEPVSVVETEPARDNIDVPPMMKIMLRQLKIDPDKLIGSVKDTVETVTHSVDAINQQLAQIMQAQARQMDHINRVNDTLLAVLARLTEVEANHRHSPMDEFGSIEPRGFELQMCVECGHPSITHENGMRCKVSSIRSDGLDDTFCPCEQFRIEPIIDASPETQAVNKEAVDATFELQRQDDTFSSRKEYPSVITRSKQESKSWPEVETEQNG